MTELGLALAWDDGRLRKVSAGLRRMLGRPEGELLGELIEDALDPVALDLDRTLIEDARGTGGVFVVVHRRDAATGGVTLLHEPSVDGSPALVWFKDLEGRYVRLNSRYTEILGVDPQAVVGRTDAELAPREAADGRRAIDACRDEPLELEYLVEGFDGRPPLWSCRFVVRDGEGEPVGLGGVSSPVAELEVGRAESARLLEIQRWSRLPRATVRAEAMAAWGLVPVVEGAQAAGPLRAVAGTESNPDGSPPPAAEHAAGLQAELAAEREARVAAESAAHGERLSRGLAEQDLAAERAAKEQVEAALAAERAAASTDAARVAAEGMAREEHAARVEAETERAALADRHARVTAELDRVRAELAELQTRRHASPAAVNGAIPGSTPAATPLGAATPGAFVRWAAGADDPPSRGPAPTRIDREQLTVALARADSVNGALAAALRVLGGSLGFDAAVAWWPDGRGRALECREVWTTPHRDLVGFETRTWQTSFALEGASPRVRAHRGSEPQWLRGEEAVAAVLVDASLLVPVRQDGAPAGLIELLSLDAREPNPTLAASVTTSAAQIGAVVHALSLASRPRWGGVPAAR
jgi:hypothetical protein